MGLEGVTHMVCLVKLNTVTLTSPVSVQVSTAFGNKTGAEICVDKLKYVIVFPTLFFDTLAIM